MSQLRNDNGNLRGAQQAYLHRKEVWSVGLHPAVHHQGGTIGLPSLQDSGRKTNERKSASFIHYYLLLFSIGYLMKDQNSTESLDMAPSATQNNLFLFRLPSSLYPQGFLVQRHSSFTSILQMISLEEEFVNSPYNVSFFSLIASTDICIVSSSFTSTIS